MKKILFFIMTILAMSNNVRAETSGIGIIEEVDLENSYIVVNRVQLKIIKGKTEVFSDKHIVGLRFLKKGVEVSYLLEDTYVTEIRLITSHEFNR